MATEEEVLADEDLAARAAEASCISSTASSLNGR
jgi:hypothetical protein